MMVGSDVTIINGGGLQVSHTSVMPEIMVSFFKGPKYFLKLNPKGIQGLIYMIFSPERRLRVLESRNSAQSSFISGKCGSLKKP